MPSKRQSPDKDKITYAPGFETQGAKEQTACRLRLSWHKDGQQYRVQLYINSNGDLVLNATDGRVVILHDCANQFAVRLER